MEKKAILGDFFYWRIKRVQLLVLIISLSVICIVILETDRELINAGILLIALFLYGLIENSSIFKKEYKTSYIIKDNALTIMNSKKTFQCNLKEIQKICYKEIKYGGKWLEPVGYRMLIRRNDKVEVFDSIYYEGVKWEETDLSNIYYYIKKELETFESGHPNKI